MQQQVPEVEIRLSELQAQIDRLNLAVHQAHPFSEHAQLAEERVLQLLERCTETLSRLTVVDERHTRAIATLEARLSDWSFIEARLEQDSDQRIRQFERIIQQEWEALRKLYEEPARQLREQAATLGETSIASANLALRGFERAEARFAALEEDLQSRMTQLTGELQGAVAELRSRSVPRSTSLPSDLPPFPLESVMRIHDELRRSDRTGADPSPDAQIASKAERSPAPKETLQLSEAAAQLSDRVESLERAVSSGQEEVRAATERTEGIRRAWRTVIIVAVLVITGAAGLVFWLQRRADARLNEAAARVAAAERQAQEATALASRRVAETQEDAERKLAEARQTALRAEIMSNVLAAPDLIRFNLAGGPTAPRANGQVLWSRSRGMVFSASRLPAPRPGATYQLWLLTNGAPVSAGVFTPDPAGRATLATDDPPNVPRPVLHAAVTVEPAGGGQQPAGETVLARPQ